MDLDPAKLQSRGVSAQDVGTALSTQTQITPAGFVKIGEYQHNFRLNNAPLSVDLLNMLPVRTVNGAVVRVRDVAHVRDGSTPQQNVVHVNGQRSALLTVLKSGRHPPSPSCRDQGDDPRRDARPAEAAENPARQ